MRSRTARTSPATAPAAAAAQAPTRRQRRRLIGGLAGGGLMLPHHITSTAHLGAVYPFALEAGLGEHGVFLGRNRLTGGQSFFFDLFAASDAGLIQGPNAVISGAGAHGKSALVKTYVYRSVDLRTAGRDRFIAVIDPKGEWVDLARDLGWTVIQLRPGGTARLNPLDAAPTIAGSSDRQHEAAESPAVPGRTTAASLDDGIDEVTAQRARTAVALLAVTLGQPELDASQQRLITATMRHLTHTCPPDQAPTLVDLRRLLAAPPTELADALDTTRDELLERRRLILDAAAMLIEHDLRGMCDGPTNLDIDWATTPGLVLDLSALLSHRKALRLVLTAAAAWLSAVMYSQPHRHKMNIIDEGWLALDDLAIVRFLQDQWRLGRQWGCGNILITHAIADLQSQTDDGAAQNKIAAGLLNTTSVRVFLHQNPEQASRSLADMGLNTLETQILGELHPFQALWKIGAHTALVDHPVASHEWAFADTDSAIL